MQNYVEFNGGGRGSNSKANRVCGRGLQKKAASAKKTLLFVTFVTPQYQLTASLPYESGHEAGDSKYMFLYKNTGFEGSEYSDLTIW